METKIRKNGEEYEAYIDREWRRTGFYKAILYCDKCGVKFEGSIYLNAFLGEIDINDCPGHKQHKDNVSIISIEDKITYNDDKTRVRTEYLKYTYNGYEIVKTEEVYREIQTLSDLDDVKLRGDIDFSAAEVYQIKEDARLNYQMTIYKDIEKLVTKCIYDEFEYYFDETEVGKVLDIEKDSMSVRMIYIPNDFNKYPDWTDYIEVKMFFERKTETLGHIRAQRRYYNRFCGWSEWEDIPEADGFEVYLFIVEV